MLLNSGMVGAMMDISDGIASDLRHILQASCAGAVIELDKLPCSPELTSICNEHGWDRYELATSGGEDFELLLTGSDDLIRSKQSAGILISHVTLADMHAVSINSKGYINSIVDYKRNA